MTAGLVAAPRARPIDRLNPVARLVFAVLLAAPVLITLDWVSASVMLGLELVAGLASGLTLAWFGRRLWPVAIVGLIAAVSMSLYGRPGGQVFAQWWLVTISQQSLLMALAVFVRILALALAAMALLGQVDPTLMADGLAQRLKLPARFVLGTLAGVRLFGLLGDDWRLIGLARRARGLGDRQWLRRLASMVFALLVVAIRRGTKLATAMEVRGFSADNAKQRSWARPSTFGWPDVIGATVTAAIVAASLVAALWAGTFWFIWTGGS